MTIDRLAVDLTGIFDNGMAFVALSRCRTLAGLRLLTPLTERAVRAHPSVVAFYQPASAPSPPLLNACVVGVLGKLSLHTRADLLALLQQHGATTLAEITPASLATLTHVIVGARFASATKQATLEEHLRALDASVVRWTEAALLDELARRGGCVDVHTQAGTKLVAPPPVVIELL